MKTNTTKALIYLGFLLIIYSCDFQNELEQVQMDNTRRELRPQDIPNVTSKLIVRLGLNNGSERFSMASDYGQMEFTIDWDKVLQSIDKYKISTYSFNINPKNKEPYEFYNLVLRIDPHGNAYKPFIVRYKMTEEFYEKYRISGNLEGFDGEMSIIPVTGASGKSAFSANLDENVRSISPDQDCPSIDLNLENGETSGGPSGISTGGTGGTGGTQVTVTRCDFYLVKNSYDVYFNGEYSYSDFYYTMEENCYEYTYVSHTEVANTGNCDIGPGEIPMLIADDYDSRTIKLESHLDQDSTLLINISCEELIKWKEVGAFKPSDKSLERLKFYDSNTHFPHTFSLQTLKTAAGKVVNLDYFSINVTQLPHGYSAESMLNEVRNNINSFIDAPNTSFRPYGPMDHASWPSNDPLGTLMHINIPGDNGVVVCTEAKSDKWKFSTITAPYLTGYHPVSGTREFGFTTNLDGSYTFYTRGVDRIGLSLNQLIENVFVGEGTSFNGSDALWSSFQQGISKFVNNNGGSSSVNEPVVGRPNWNDIKEFLNGNKDISELGCK